MKRGKQTKTLPNPQALQQLAKGPKTINDYSKAAAVSTTASPSLIQNLRGMK